MSVIDKTYHHLLQTILDDGFTYEDPNRKGVNRIQIPSYTFKHDFKDGFPAITTKKLYWKGVVAELLWILKGDTNIKYLVDNGVNIWNKDAYNYYKNDMIKKSAHFNDEETYISQIKSHGKIVDNGFVYGNLGRVYGAQWRDWQSVDLKNSMHDYEIKYVDQISNLIKGLKKNPMGTKHIVTAWNPAELDDMALPPCHYQFIILPEPLTLEERFGKSEFNTLLDEYSEEELDLLADEDGYPKYKFTLKFSMRSSDVFLGLPFNLSSYALLAQIIGKMTNMIPKSIIGDLSNVHIYEPHLDAVKEQLKRNVDKYDKCELRFAGEESNQGLEKGNVDIFNNLEVRNFRLRDYESYPVIPAEMLPYNK